MRKVIVEVFDDGLSPFTKMVDDDSSYDLFHSTVGVVLGNIAGANGGLENISAHFDDSTNIDTERTELATAIFVWTGDGEMIATVTLIE